MNKVKYLREQKNWTQMELAEKSGLSLRTVQRVEAGSIPKGFTLNSLAKSLDTKTENLFEKTEENAVERAKLINFSALAGLIIPFGGVIVPLILTFKTKDFKNKQIGKEIVTIQILLATILSILLIASPFIQKEFSIQFPIFLLALFLFIGLKLFVIIKNGISLNTKKELAIRLKTNFL